jgi:excinuclease ABC subunit B
MAILYGDKVTDSMRRAIDETERRRAKQIAFNTANGITPKGISKEIRDLIDGVYSPQEARAELMVAQDHANYEAMSDKQVSREIKRLEKQMHDYAKNLEFEKAAGARDQLQKLKQQLFGATVADHLVPLPGDESNRP